MTPKQNIVIQQFYNCYCSYCCYVTIILVSQLLCLTLYTDTK